MQCLVGLACLLLRFGRFSFEQSDTGICDLLSAVVLVAVLDPSDKPFW